MRGDLAVLDDVDAARIGAARVPPGDRIVPRDAGAPLQRRAEDRIARVGRRVDDRHHRLHLRRGEHLAVDAVQPVGVDAPLDVAHVLQRVSEVQHAALAEHHVEVEVLGEPLPELHRLLVQVRRLVPQVVGADDRRVAARVAAADPALLQHRDVGDAVLLGEVVRGREPVAAAADDDDVVLAPGLGIPPRGLPLLVVGPRVAGEAPDRIAVHALPDVRPSAAGRMLTYATLAQRRRRTVFWQPFGTGGRPPLPQSRGSKQ